MTNPGSGCMTNGWGGNQRTGVRQSQNGPEHAFRWRVSVPPDPFRLPRSGYELLEELGHGGMGFV